MGILAKFFYFRSKRLTDSARGQCCQNCFVEDGTTASAHSNWAEHGKGKSVKASDIFIAWLCMKCHSWLDQGKGRDPTGIWADTEKADMWRRAHDRTLTEIFKQGRVVVS